MPNAMLTNTDQSVFLISQLQPEVGGPRTITTSTIKILAWGGKGGNGAVGGTGGRGAKGRPGPVSTVAELCIPDSECHRSSVSANNISFSSYDI
jgi:hypothetical protein